MQRLLDRVRILDLTTGLAGPYCTRMLADLGAEVIKVEPLEGDDARALPPAGAAGQVSATFVELNCGKQGISLDLEAPAARAALLRLLSLCDALVEDGDEEALASAGLGYAWLAARYPWLVHCSITPYGRTGPYARRPGSGLTADAVGGILDQTGFAGESPLPLGYAFGEMNAGIHAVAALIAALFKQRREGVGQHLDISMAECSLSVQDTAVQEYLFSGGQVVRSRAGAGRSSLVPYGVFKGPDGYLALTGWERFCAAIERPDLAADPRFATPAARQQHMAEVWRELEAWLGRVGGVHEGQRRLQAADTVAFRVRTVAEALADPQVAARGLLASIEDPERGLLRVRNSPFHFSGASADVRSRAPRLGEHNRAVLAELCGFPQGWVQGLPGGQARPRAAGAEPGPRSKSKRAGKP